MKRLVLKWKNGHSTPDYVVLSLGAVSVLKRLCHVTVFDPLFSHHSGQFTNLVIKELRRLPVKK